MSQQGKPHTAVGEATPPPAVQQTSRFSTADLPSSTADPPFQYSRPSIQYSRPPASAQQTSRFSTATHHFTLYILHFTFFCPTRLTCPTCLTPHPRKGSQPTPQGRRRHASRATQKSVQGRCLTPAGKTPNPSREDCQSQQGRTSIAAGAAVLLSEWLYLPFVCLHCAIIDISRQNGKCLLHSAARWNNGLPTS